MRFTSRPRPTATRPKRLPGLYQRNPDPNIAVNADTETTGSGKPERNASRHEDRLQQLANDLAGKVKGELDTTTLTRAIYSTDAGNYRVIPQAVFAPRSKTEAITAIRACQRLGIPITARGAGTSCAGNAIGPGLIIDFQRHLNRVIAIDPERRRAIVEPGCVEATLQAAAAPHGLRFGPDPSTQNRCTIGGMVGNNACGPHATAWGKTAENIASLELIDGCGRHYHATNTGINPITEAANPNVPAASHPKTTAGPLADHGEATPLDELTRLVDANLEVIRPHFGQFSRQVSGYSLEYLLPEKHRNIAAFLVGSEGTLATALEIEVKLVDIPSAPALVAIGYPDMIAAGYDVPNLLKHRPLAVEGLDSRLLNVVRTHHGDGAIPPLPTGQGWLLCEVSGDTLEQSLSKAQALAEAARSEHYAIYPPGKEANALWRIRADGAGLGGRTPASTDENGNPTGNEQAWPGWEDAAVPPEHLGDYLTDFTALMREHGIDGLLYGHFGDGCVHVRLDMPLGSQTEVAHTETFLIESAKLLGRYRGSLSGEHGDGRSRSQLLPHMYPPRVIELFAAVKAIFDPDNLMNPGVITHPDPLAANLRRPQAHPYPASGGFQFTHDHGDFTTAVHRCTGVSKCRVDLTGSGGFMCPSYQASGEEIDSTRGRARILEELTNGELITTWDDPRVTRAMDLCLACKACSADCPAGVDMAKYRSETLHRRYAGRLRPRTHYFLGQLPRLTRLTATIPALAPIANQIMRVNALRRTIFALAGIDPRRTMPRLQSHLFNRVASRQNPQLKQTTQALKRLRAAATNTPPATNHPATNPHSGNAHTHPRYVVIFADSFSQTLDDRGARDLVDVLLSAGYTPLLPPRDICCGLTWITTGQLPTARKKLTELVKTLAPFARAGIPIVGVEPSCTAVLRDDLLDLGINHPDVETVSAATRTLAELLTAPAPHGPTNDNWLADLTGINIIAQPHCHHYSVMGWQADRALLQRMGANITELSGCCGLAGNFGMERGHYETSVKIAQHSLLPALAADPNAIYLADGFSCRTQAEQLAGRQGIHLATLIRTRASSSTR